MQDEQRCNSLTNIFLIGSMGAGKSTLGRLLATALKRPFYDSDKVIEERCGASIPWIFDLEGEEGFREREIQTIDDLTQLKGIILSTGGGSVIKPENRQHLKERGVVIFLRTTVEQQLLRTSNDRNRPLLQTDDPRAKLDALKKVRDPLYLATAHIVVDTDQRPPRQVMLDIKAQLMQHL
ncbi:MAG TPA: shikimate kinase AroK [Marinospirillum sp.]|uniref:shikimate kinase AroK n=1 Tax=Marinospirillum sp. TaxID=2183934 RepID=UPI002B49F6D2|nr:shikimate kinase AroK [Marinospirillum sp.]HKM16553.1 shikimate kinase AroK [Marinospirillum sp.]